MADDYLTGVEAEVQKLRDFPAKVEANVLRGAVRAGAVVMKNAVAPLVPRVTGALAGTLRVTTSVRKGVALAGVKLGNRRRGVFYAAMVLGGTKPHEIAARSQGGFLSFGGLVRRVVRHPGAKAQPILDQANASAGDKAVQAAFDYADTRTRQLVADQGNGA